MSNFQAKIMSRMSSVPNLWGWISDKELEWLSTTVATLPTDSVIVEIGTWLGKSTSAMVLSMTNPLCFVTIDTWEGQSDLVVKDHALATTGKLKDMFLDNMSLLGFNFLPYEGIKNGTFYITGAAEEVFSQFSDSSIDMFFHDGDHRVLGRDLDLWRPKFKPNVILCGHDYSPVFPLIIKDVNERLYVDEQIDVIWVGNRWKS